MEGISAVSGQCARVCLLQIPQKRVPIYPMRYSMILFDLSMWQWRRRFMERYVCARIKFQTQSVGCVYKWMFRGHFKPGALPGLPGRRVTILDLILQPSVKPA